MQKNIIVTGSTSGLGLASRQLLEKSGARVIGIDVKPGAEITADLSTKAGVEEAIAQIKTLCNGTLHGVFANAGVDNQNAPLVFGLNYFGVIQLLEGLNPLLKASGDGRVLVNASNSVVITPSIPMDVVDALLQHNAEQAYALIEKCSQWTYQVSKVAITKWARKVAPTTSWAGSNISMNIIAPGVVMTPLIEHDLKDPRKAAGINMLPRPIGRFANPEDVVPLVKFLLLDDSQFIIGQYIVIDGGTEAALKGSVYPAVWDIPMEEYRKKLS